MHIDPTSPLTPLATERPTRARQAGGPEAFGRVVELAEARAARAAANDPIPPEVRADMARAAELVDELAAGGRAVRFDHGLDGKVVAALTDDAGAVIKHLGLSDLLGSFGPQDVA